MTCMQYSLEYNSSFLIRSTIVSQVSLMVLGANIAQLGMPIYEHIVQQLEHE